MKSTALVWMSSVMVGLFFAGSSYSKVDPATVAGLWLFDEDDDDVAEDLSGNGNDGTLRGDPDQVKGKFGAALEFDGIDDYVNCGNSDSLLMTDQVTVAFWFRTNKKMVAFADRQAVVGKSYLEYEVGIYPGGCIHTYTNDGTGGGYDEGISAYMREELGENDWKLDKWYHVAWTLNGKHEIVYVNGVNIGEFNKPNEGTKEGIHNLEIGRREAGSLLFNGAVDEVVIFNVALEQADIQDIMNKGMEKVLGLTAVSPSDKLATTWATIKA